MELEASTAVTAEVSSLDDVLQFLGGFFEAFTGGSYLTEFQACAANLTAEVQEIKNDLDGLNFSTWNIANASQIAASFLELIELIVNWKEVFEDFADHFENCASAPIELVDDLKATIVEWEEVIYYNSDPADIARLVFTNFFLNLEEIIDQIEAFITNWIGGDFYNSGKALADAIPLVVADAEVNNDACWKDTYGRGAGKFP